MFLSVRRSLQRRMLFLGALGTVVMLGGLGLFSFLAVKESIDRTLQERLTLAQATASYLEYVVGQNLRTLEDISFAEGINLKDNTLEPEKRALREVYLHSIFDQGVVLTDSSGTILWSEPYRPQDIGLSLTSFPYVAEALETGRPLVSNAFNVPRTGQALVSLAAPLRSRDGQILGLIVGDIDLTGSGINDLLRPARLGKTGYIEIVDGHGVVLSSTNPQHVLEQSDHGNRLAALIAARKTTVGTCHSCHQETEAERETEVMAFAPLTTVPWGVTIRQAEAEALAPAFSLQRRLTIFGIALLGMVLLLTWGVARSILRPVTALNRAAQRIAAGNLSDPVADLGEDELGNLAHSLDGMRQRLKTSLEEIQEWNRDLEKREEDRTRELERSRAARGELLQKLITAQEEERKRIARELHDDTSQTLVALAMALDTAAATLGNNSNTKAKLASMRSLAVNDLDGIRDMILGLRPSLLDDLGLVAALRWYAESRLDTIGIQVDFVIEGKERRLPSQVETALFRVAQEAMANIAKHSEAENASISLQFNDDTISMRIADDGKGFDVTGVMGADQRENGFGLLGMQERVALLGGSISIKSSPGHGTVISIGMPV